MTEQIEEILRDLQHEWSLGYGVDAASVTHAVERIMQAVAPASISDAWSQFWQTWHAASDDERSEFARRTSRSYHATLQRELMASLQRLAPELWELVEGGVCDECGEESLRRYRLKRAPGYSRMRDPQPKYRCEACSIRKHEAIRGL